MQRHANHSVNKRRQLKANIGWIPSWGNFHGCQGPRNVPSLGSNDPKPQHPEYLSRPTVRFVLQANRHHQFKYVDGISRRERRNQARAWAKKDLNMMRERLSAGGQDAGAYRNRGFVRMMLKDVFGMKGKGERPAEATA